MGSVTPVGWRVPSRADVMPCIKVEVLMVSVLVDERYRRLAMRTLENIGLTVLGP